jgi:hypothetical protein
VLSQLDLLRRTHVLAGARLPQHNGKPQPFSASNRHSIWIQIQKNPPSPQTTRPLVGNLQVPPRNCTLRLHPRVPLRLLHHKQTRRKPSQFSNGI